MCIMFGTVKAVISSTCPEHCHVYAIACVEICSIGGVAVVQRALCMFKLLMLVMQVELSTHMPALYGNLLL